MKLKHFIVLVCFVYALMFLSYKFGQLDDMDEPLSMKEEIELMKLEIEKMKIQRDMETSKYFVSWLQNSNRKENPCQYSLSLNDVKKHLKQPVYNDFY
jgi:hypothetical protein